MSTTSEWQGRDHERESEGNGSTNKQIQPLFFAFRFSSLASVSESVFTPLPHKLPNKQPERFDESTKLRADEQKHHLRRRDGQTHRSQVI